MKYFCENCGTEEVQNKKHGLCTRCYGHLRRKGLLIFKPKTEDQKRKTLISNLKKKHSSQILDDICKVNSNWAWSLTRVAKKYKVTRERARQWYKIIFGHGYGEVLREKAKKKKQDIACIHDPRRKVADFKPNSSTHKGVKAEKKFLQECQKRELNFSIPCTQHIDIKINGYDIDVKTCLKATMTSPGIKVKYFRYNCRGIQVEIADFFACYHPTEKRFFIIPRSATNKIGKHGTISIYISERQSDYYIAKNRYWEYRDAWHLLKKKKKVKNSS